MTVAKINACFGRNAYSQATIYRWIQQFESGRVTLSDLQRSGKPKTARSEDKVEECKELVARDKRIGIHQLSRTLSISYGSTFMLMHKDLMLSKRAGKLIPHQLTNSQKRNRVMFCEDLIENYTRDPRCLQWVMTTDESYFHVYEPRSKYENMS